MKKADMHTPPPPPPNLFCELVGHPQWYVQLVAVECDVAGLGEEAGTLSLPTLRGTPRKVGSLVLSS